MPASELFNPLDKRNLAKSIINAIHDSQAERLDLIESFKGAGIYAIYYRGSFPPYRPIASKNRKVLFAPIYAGKAVPEGARKGGLGDAVPSGNYLFKRLMEHRKSIEASTNLSIGDFWCRHLVVDDIWIPLGESLLIEESQPLWNVVVDGFGNHPPGQGRIGQQKSSWDVLHPGRSWAEGLAPCQRSLEDLEAMVRNFLASAS